MFGHEHESPRRGALEVIEIRSPSIAEFPGDRRVAAMATCNRLNHEAAGKFVLNEDGALEYRLLWVITANVWTQDFGQMIASAVHDVNRFYSRIVAARFGVGDE